MTEPTLVEFLRAIADEMERGDYAPTVEAILVTRDMETDTLTMRRWGERTRILTKAARLSEGRAQ